MRSLKSSLFAIALSGLFGTAAVVGCSASGGDSGIGTEGEPTDPMMMDPGSSGGSKLPPPSKDDGSHMDAGGTDSGKKDSGPKPEAGVDAGPPPPVEGTPCPTLNAIGSKKCGACGTSETVCLDDGSGKGKWSMYGACNNELAGGCVPGTVTVEDCGNCGKVTKTCTQYCAYSSSACTGQPMNNCAPGDVDYTNAGCPAQSYHNRTCGAACTWSNFSPTCDAPNNANKMTIPAVGVTINQTFQLTAAKVGPRVTGSCPGATVTGTDYPYEIVEIKNADATKTAKVSVWNDGAPSIDALIVAYNTNLPPTTSTQLAACTWGVNDFCPSTLPCSAHDDWGGLTGTQQLVIPPGQVVLVRFGAYYGLSSAGETNTGPAPFYVRTDSLN
jgi:hypothetical protein